MMQSHFLKSALAISVVFFLVFRTSAQDDVSYLTPPQVISDMLLAKPTSSVSFDESGTWMLIMEREGYQSVEELARPELRLAGVRINPENFARSRQSHYRDLVLHHIPTGTTYPVTGLPEELAASDISWSPSEGQIAFLHTTRSQVDLYVIDVATRSASKRNRTPLNLVTGDYFWVDDNTILYRGVVHPASASPSKPRMPKGPAIQENYGKASPRPTYQDMIKTPHDEDLFAFYATTQLIRNTDGTEHRVGAPAIYHNVRVSPDRSLLMVETVRRPFSYLVPFWGFASSISVTDLDGNLVTHVIDLPSSETAPSGYDNVQNVPRAFEWRDDAPATLIWCEPLDSGLIKNEAEHRDAVYAWSAPFKGEPVQLFKTRMRYSGTTWGNAGFAIMREGLRSKQVTQTSALNPTTGETEILQTRNTTDAYTYPGYPITVQNQYDRNVLYISSDRKLLFNNTTGSSPKGDLPFLMSFDIESKSVDTLWKCREGYYEYVAQVIDPNTLTIVTRRESKTEVPNYWLKDLRRRIADRQLTQFENPYPQLEGTTKEKITYKREDGITLTGELHLPKGYDAQRDGTLPVLIWAYPREYQSAADAAQIRGSENRFTMVSGGSPLFYVTQGYAVLNSAEMPIVATSEDKKPNDDFVDQLRMNAEAAIDKLVYMGVGDRERMAIGGHSYGAFMTANLLAHTDLFKAGIARSGAYNRSLTPFGFQNEDRTYWEAPEIYFGMSPFSYAHKINEPILLIHGDSDNNTGTYPIQSERMFNAIKGHGGTARYVSLPHESHGYAGKESLLHVLAEQLNWMDRYVKGTGGNGKS